MATNSIGSAGLTTQTLVDIINEIENGTQDFPGMYQIYGADINLNPNSPDGQMVNIIAQAKLDGLQQGVSVNSFFDPDQAVGTILDARCAINGVTRQAGTFTQQQVQVTVTAALTVNGLDNPASLAFTVSDSEGNQYQLETTTAFTGAGTQTLMFQATLLGPIQAAPNTITQIVTVQSGVSGVNNSGGPFLVGLTSESDAALRIRRQNSVELPSRGYLPGLYGALLAVTGVSNAEALENDTSATDARGIPPHSIWCIVEGGVDADIADAINRKRNGGCGMRGGVSVTVSQVSGPPLAILFDRPIAENLYIKVTGTALSGSLDGPALQEALLEQLIYTIGQPADSSEVIALLKSIAPNGSYSAEGVSTDGTTYVTTPLATTDVQHQWATDPTRTLITIV